MLRTTWEPRDWLVVGMVGMAVVTLPWYWPSLSPALKSPAPVDPPTVELGIGRLTRVEVICPTFSDGLAFCYGLPGGEVPPVDFDPDPINWKERIVLEGKPLREVQRAWSDPAVREKKEYAWVGHLLTEPGDPPHVLRFERGRLIRVCFERYGSAQRPSGFWSHLPITSSLMNQRYAVARAQTWLAMRYAVSAVWAAILVGAIIGLLIHGGIAFGPKILARSAAEGQRLQVSDTNLQT